MLLFIPRSLCALKRVAAKSEHVKFGATQGIRILLAAGLFRAEALQCKDLPDDTGWVGSDIRNCCQTAYMLNTSLKEAAQWITLVGRTARADIERLRELAQNLGFLSANQPGIYRRAKETDGRAIKL